MKCTNLKRCRYWNRGYCREGTSRCPYYHPPDDCQEHLQEGLCSTQGCQLRHRNKCKYWGTKAGCFRKGQCQYLHVKNQDRVHNKDVETDIMVMKEINNCEHLEVGKDPIKNSAEGKLKSTSSENVLTNNVERKVKK